MIRKLTLLIAALIASISYAQMSDSPSQKRRTEQTIFAASPASLEHLTDSCSTVVRVQVLDATAVLRPVRIGSDVFTEIRGRVISSAKGSLRPGQTIMCLQRAGRVETQDEIIEVARQTPVTAGSEYVLFLNWNNALSSYVVYSLDGVYRIRNGFLAPFGQSEIAKKQSGRAASALLDDVRARARRELVK
jgi:hypothetical protein